MTDGLTHPTDAVLGAAEEIEEAISDAGTAARAMVDALEALAAAVPGTLAARQATALAADWAADAAAWAAAAQALGHALEDGVDDQERVEEALAASFGR
ncbi:MAG: hypothetical protein QOE59_5023 [Actinomycetota bacterium]|jgi:hypothetical protein|nr:hypothetical protein [Actinomycetota bacterium]